MKATTGRVRRLPMARFRAELEAMLSTGAKANWWKVRQVLDELDRLGGVEHTGHLTVETVSRYIASRPPGQSAWTLKSVLSTLRSICSIAHDSGYLAVSPFAMRPMAKWVRPRPPEGKRCPTREEVRRLMELLAREVVEEPDGWGRWRARRLQALVGVAALAGLRAGEACRLWIEDLDQAAGIVHVRPHGKTLKTHTSAQPVAMPDALAEILRAWLPHRLEAPAAMKLPSCPWLIPNLTRRGPWIGGTSGYRPTDAVRAAGVRAGVEGLTLQSLRRAFSTAAIAAGVPSMIVARQCRHSEDVSRQWYVSREVSMLTEALKSWSY